MGKIKKKIFFIFYCIQLNSDYMDKDAFEKFVNNDFKKLSNSLFSLSAFEFNLLATLIGFALTPALSTNEQNSLGNFFALIGQVLMTANAQNITLAANKAKVNNFEKFFQTNNTNDEIILIKEEIIKIYNSIFNNC